MTLQRSHSDPNQICLRTKSYSSPPQSNFLRSSGSKRLEYMKGFRHVSCHVYGQLNMLEPKGPIHCDLGFRCLCGRRATARPTDMTTLATYDHPRPKQTKSRQNTPDFYYIIVIITILIILICFVFTFLRRRSMWAVSLTGSELDRKGRSLGLDLAKPCDFAVGQDLVLLDRWEQLLRAELKRRDVGRRCGGRGGWAGWAGRRIGRVESRVGGGGDKCLEGDLLLASWLERRCWQPREMGSIRFHVLIWM